MTRLVRHCYTQQQLSSLTEECGLDAVSNAIGHLSTYRFHTFGCYAVDLAIDTLGGVCTIEAEYRTLPLSQVEYVLMATWEGDRFTFHDPDNQEDV